MPSLTTLIGGAPSARRSPHARPAAQVPPSSTLASGNATASTPSRWRKVFADTIQQRDGKRAPLHHQRPLHVVFAAPPVRGIAQLQDAAIDKESAVAVFGKAREAVDSVTSMPARCSGSISE